MSRGMRPTRPAEARGARDVGREARDWGGGARDVGREARDMPVRAGRPGAVRPGTGSQPRLHQKGRVIQEFGTVKQ
ncbi:hypothetical protein AB0N19_03000, partial [Streptomyces sp. NPDC051132]